MTWVSTSGFPDIFILESEAQIRLMDYIYSDGPIITATTHLAAFIEDNPKKYQKKTLN